MGPLSTAILVGCLQGVSYLLYLVAALIAALLATQAWRGALESASAGLAVGAVAALLAGLVCRRAATFFLDRGRETGSRS